MQSVGEAIHQALERDGVALLPPMDAEDTLALLAGNGVTGACVMLDPWYNKGVGGVQPRDEYDAMIRRLLTAGAALAGHVYLWGFPEIVARYVDDHPEPLALEAWLTWFYKNNPSVIRGWRSAQMACLHFRVGAAPLYPEHFLTPAQLDKQRKGKLRYLPGPTSVLEGDLGGPPDVISEALIIGFIRKAEQTGHPSQKPESVYDHLVRMVTAPGDVVIDPMAGSGTTGAVARTLGRRAVLADHEPAYVGLMEERLGVERLRL